MTPFTQYRLPLHIRSQLQLAALVDNVQPFDKQSYVERVTRPDEQFSYNPRTKRGKELLERLNGGEESK